MNGRDTTTLSWFAHGRYSQKLRQKRESGMHNISKHMKLKNICEGR